MAHQPTQQARMAVAEFLDWQGERGVRYQLFDGVRTAMRPPRSFHRTIVANA